MEKVLTNIRAIVQDVRLFPQDSEIRDIKLREVEDMCTMAIRVLGEIRGEEN